tara:strand:- start:32191 stop:32451 length:261 start_codon:yes stop_codon:yes gene_type:complete
MNDWQITSLGNENTDQPGEGRVNSHPEDMKGHRNFLTKKSRFFRDCLAGGHNGINNQGASNLDHVVNLAIHQGNSAPKSRPRRVFS